MSAGRTYGNVVRATVCGNQGRLPILLLDEHFAVILAIFRNLCSVFVHNLLNNLKEEGKKI